MIRVTFLCNDSPLYLQMMPATSLHKIMEREEASNSRNKAENKDINL